MQVEPILKMMVLNKKFADVLTRVRQGMLPPTKLTTASGLQQFKITVLARRVNKATAYLFRIPMVLGSPGKFLNLKKTIGLESP